MKERITVLLALLHVSTSFTMAAAAKPIKTVAIVGGTHGNEYTGVWCVKSLEENEQSEASSASSASPSLKRTYPSLSISTLIGNPQAFLANRRFLDTDLNREFSLGKLTAKDSSTVERRRAVELNALLGPKQRHQDESPPKTDLIIDLHSTTTNMGMTLIVQEGDALMTQAASYVLSKMKDCHILMHSVPDRMDRPNLSSISTHGFTIEVGPVPQGVVRHDAVEKTTEALHLVLEFVERKNSDSSSSSLASELRAAFPNGRVPCFRSAQAKRPGEISGKIPWPSDETNPNFPTYMVHKSIQDQDFKEIRTGDPLFVKRDGRTVVPYSGSHGDKVYLMFINEGGYYYSASGTGIGVAVKAKFDLETGTFTNEQEEEEAKERAKASSSCSDNSHTKEASPSVCNL